MKDEVKQFEIDYIFSLEKVCENIISVLFHFTAELRQRIPFGPFQEGHGQAIYLGEDRKKPIF